MEQPAAFLDVTGNGREAFMRRGLPRRVCLDGGDVRLKHLQVVEVSEDLLRPFEMADERRCRRNAAVGREFESVTELLGRDAHPVQLLGGIQLSGAFDGRGKRLGALDESRAERVAPCVRSFRGSGGRAEQPPIELREIYRGKPRQHVLPAVVTCGSNVQANVLQSWSGQVWGFGKVVDQSQRDIELAHRAERPRHLTNFPGGFLLFCALTASSQHRDRLAKATRRHPCAMHARVVPVDSGRQRPAEGPGPNVE